MADKYKDKPDSIALRGARDAAARKLSSNSQISIVRSIGSAARVTGERVTAGSGNLVRSGGGKDKGAVQKK